MFGKAERQLLLMAWKRPVGMWVHIDEPDLVKRETLFRAAKAMERLGLLDRANIEIQYAYPKRARAHVRLTAIGHKFCATYSSQLQSGGRISLRHLEKKHGITIPQRRKEMPPWLISNPPRASNQRPASTDSRTAA